LPGGSGAFTQHAIETEVGLPTPPPQFM